MQALNPVAIVVLVHTNKTYEHSLHLEDIPSFRVQSLEAVGGPQDSVV